MWKNQWHLFMWTRCTVCDQWSSDLEWLIAANNNRTSRLEPHRLVKRHYQWHQCTIRSILRDLMLLSTIKLNRVRISQSILRDPMLLSMIKLHKAQRRLRQTAIFIQTSHQTTIKKTLTLFHIRIKQHGHLAPAGDLHRLFYYVFVFVNVRILF